MLTRLAIACMSISPFMAHASVTCDPSPGDVTHDGTTNVLDVQCVVTAVHWSIAEVGGVLGCLDGPAGLADLDCEGKVTVSDVQVAIRHALKMPLDPILDADGDGCVDACVPANVVMVTVLGTSGAPVQSATVKLGEVVQQTGASGVVAVPAPPDGATTLVATHPAYAPASRALEMKGAAELAIILKLIPFETYGPFAADSEVVIHHGLARVAIPANSVVLSDGSAPIGPVEVRAAVFDPTSMAGSSSPGSGVGVATDGGKIDLESLFMMEVSLLADGAPAQLAPGATATLRLPVLGELSERYHLGDIVPAWWYDVDAGEWQADGVGAIEADADLGLVWVAAVSHFTWWQAGASGWWNGPPVACVLVTVTDGTSGAPVAGAQIRSVRSDGKQVVTGATGEAGTDCMTFVQGDEVEVIAFHPEIGTSETHAFEVPAGESATCHAEGLGCESMTLVLEPRACVRGLFASPDGTPLAHATATGSFSYPGILGETETYVGTSANGEFCMAASPGEPVTVWAATNSGAVVESAGATAVPIAASAGCGGGGCLDLGVLTLEAAAWGDEGVPHDCLCAVHGAAGSTVACPVRVASTSDASNFGTLMSGAFTYDAGLMSFSEAIDVLCLDGVGCFELPVTESNINLSTGHSLFLAPYFEAIGGFPFVLWHPFPSTPLAQAMTDGAGALTSGEPTIMTLRFQLEETIPASAPALVCVSSLSLVNGQGQVLAKYVQNGAITTAGVLPTGPGTKAGCPAVLGDFSSSGSVTPSDVKCATAVLRHAIGGTGPAPECNTHEEPLFADLDCSSAIDLVDVYVASVAAMGQPLSPLLDANDDGCIDRCAPQ